MLSVGNSIGLDETNTVEFKNYVPNAPNLAKTIMAFANTNGGKVYLGIKNNGIISGILPNKPLMAWKDEFRLCIDAATSMLMPTYKERVLIEFIALSSVSKSNTRYMIVLSVQKSSIVYSFESGETWIRREASNAKNNDVFLKSNVELQKELDDATLYLKILEDKLIATRNLKQKQIARSRSWLEKIMNMAGLE